MAMTPDPGDPGRDPRLEALYRAGSEPLQPPPRLDDAIRAAARRAVHAGPRRGSDRLRRWSVPLSLAAVMLLSITIVTMMREEGADRWTDDIAPPRQPLPEAKVAAPDRRAEPPAVVAPAVPKQEAPPPVPAAAPAKQAAAAKPVQAEVARERVQQEVRAREVPEKRDSALAKTAPAESASAGAGTSARDARDDQTPPMAAPPRPLRRSAPAAEADATAARGQLMAPAPLGAAAGKSADPLWQDLEQAPAGKWLDRLRELRSADRTEEFARLSAEFRRRFPDIALPADLR